MANIKRSLQLVGAFITIFTSPLLAQIPSPPPEVAAQTVREDHYPARQVTFPNGVKGLPGVVYSEPSGYRPLLLDVYLPPTSVQRPASGFPMIVYVHGGGWLRGNSHSSGPFVDFPGVLAALSARGYVVASIDYRFSSEAIFPAPEQDVKSAIRWLRSRAVDYGIDTARAMIWGGSSGGHLASLAAVSCGAQQLEPPQANKDTAAKVSDCVQGSVIWYGVFDLATITTQAHGGDVVSRDAADASEWRMLGCFPPECKQGQVAAASPVTYVDAKTPPMLLIVGDADKTVPHEQTLEMAEKLKAAGVPHELIILPGVEHLFIGKTQQQTREANLKALDATFRFIDKTMNNAH